MNTTNDQGPEAKHYDIRHTEEDHGQVMKQVTKGNVKAKKKLTTHKILNNGARRFITKLKEK